MPYGALPSEKSRAAFRTRACAPPAPMRGREEQRTVQCVSGRDPDCLRCGTLGILPSTDTRCSLIRPDPREARRFQQPTQQTRHCRRPPLPRFPVPILLRRMEGLGQRRAGVVGIQIRQIADLAGAPPHSSPSGRALHGFPGRKRGSRGAADSSCPASSATRPLRPLACGSVPRGDSRRCRSGSHSGAADHTPSPLSELPVPTPPSNHLITDP